MIREGNITADPVIGKDWQKEDACYEKMVKGWDPRGSRIQPLPR